MFITAPGDNARSIIKISIARARGGANDGTTSREKARERERKQLMGKGDKEGISSDSMGPNERASDLVKFENGRTNSRLVYSARSTDGLG